MKANELRIGNFVNADNLAKVSLDFGNYFIVERLHKYNDYIGLKSPMFKNFIWSDVVNTRPIPLTEEWLIRLGFKYYKHWDYWQIKGDNRLKVYPRGNGFYYMVAHHFEIKHVHQLQNLYFALTGEELNLHK